MLTITLTALFERDLDKLQQEISLYKDEKKLWETGKHISNSAGNLTLHLIGNLNHFIGATLGGSGYVRNRPLEFSQRDIPRDELLGMIGKTAAVVKETLGRLGESDLQKEYPLPVFDKPTGTEFFLVHLSTHLAYHLGQINYHRRMLDI